MILPQIDSAQISSDLTDEHLVFVEYVAGIRTALLIRKTEQRLLDLFAEGRVFGTVHTSIGQEFVGVAVARCLRQSDTIFSNHRGHGHYLARFGDVEGLIAEVMGKANGVCGGRGGSQHMQRDLYFSNGIQGGIVPVATGLGFGQKLSGSEGISVVFIGDGTLGQGALYESLNIASKWDLPVMFVCENNFFAQSTSQQQTLAGDICLRAEAFGIETGHGSTWTWRSLFQQVRAMADKIRSDSRPRFLRVDTFRLMAHSKGDDNRPPEFVESYRRMDPLVRLEETWGDDPRWQEMVAEIDSIIESAVAAAEGADFADVSDSRSIRSAREGSGGSPHAASWVSQSFPRERIVQSINRGLREGMEKDDRILLIGEDIESPYGGAFKCTRDLSDLFPGRVRNTPISELAIVGIGNGLALFGKKPVVEIMFGDFLTLAADQWINHAAKFRYMYNDRVTVPLLIRTPMGGRRGYAATHSQSLEKHFLGLPGTQVLCLHHRMDVAAFYRDLLSSLDRPTLVVENKLLYGQFSSDQSPPGFDLVFNSGDAGATAKLRPHGTPDVTIVAIGGMGLEAEEAVGRLFREMEITAELLLPASLYPFEIQCVMESVSVTGRLLLVEEGQGFVSLSSEVLAQVAERYRGSAGLRCRRVTASPVPIPASRPAETACLPGVSEIVNAARDLVQ